jgi:hypothetical protein
MTDLAAAPSIVLPWDYVDRDFPVSVPFGAVDTRYWIDGHKGQDRGAVRDKTGKILRPIEGAQVKTLWPGTVQLAGYEKNFGNRVWILFEDARYGACRYLFAHLKEIFLVEGSKITAEPVVAGLVGGTGTRRDGSAVPVHIHLQIERLPSREVLRPVLPKEGGKP